MSNWISLGIPSKTSCHFYRNSTFTKFCKITLDASHEQDFALEFHCMKELEKKTGTSSYFPRYYEYGLIKDGHYPFIVMEYIHGDTLTKLLKKHYSPYQPEPRFLFSKEELQDIFSQVYEALCILAHNNILHFDLSTDNIIVSFVDGKPCVKLIDFSSFYYIPYGNHMQKCHAINNRIDPKFPPPLKLLQATMLLFVRLFFTSQDSYDCYLLNLKKHRASADFFYQHFQFILDLVIAPEEFNYDQKLLQANTLFEKEDCDYLYFLTEWYESLEKKFHYLLSSNR